MKVYNLFLIISTIFTVGICSAQRTPVFADYYYNTIALNPAYAGYHENTEITLSGRTHLSNIDGLPSTMNLTFHGPSNNEKTGFGAMVTRDNVGITSKTGIYGAYAYKLTLDYGDYNSEWRHHPKTLSFGLIGGISKYEENLLSLNITNDPNFSNNINVTIPSFGAGVFYSSRLFYIGVSSPNLLEPSFSSENNVNIRSDYYLNTGIRIYRSRFLYLEPSILIKYTDGAPLQLDTNLILNYLDKMELGIGYRTTSTLNLLAGFYIFNNFRIIYNYNLTLRNSPLNQTHGIGLSYRFGQGFSFQNSFKN